VHTEPVPKLIADTSMEFLSKVLMPRAESQGQKTRQAQRRSAGGRKMLARAAWYRCTPKIALRCSHSRACHQQKRCPERAGPFCGRRSPKQSVYRSTTLEACDANYRHNKKPYPRLYEPARGRVYLPGRVRPANDVLRCRLLPV
jgi:hypothetical protein